MTRARLHMRTIEKMGSRSRWPSYIILFWILLSFTAIGYSKKKPKLKIITESKPDSCTEGAEIGDKLTLHYTGAFTNGKVFDSSRQRDPFTIQLGAKQVIPGWEEGLIGICEGELRKLIIPPDLAYGDRGVEGVIPGGATLIFSIEVMGLEKPAMISWNQNTVTLVGVVILIGLLVFEVYRRYKKENENLQQNKSLAKKGSKKKR